MQNKKPQILLAEDDFNLGNLLSDCLSAEGFKIELYDNGEMALTAFQEGKFDICLLDVMMPKMNGFDVAKAIRKINAVVPIIFITAKSFKEDKLFGYSLGIDDYITKPFDEEELICKIKAILRRSAPIDSDILSDTIQLGSLVFDYKNQCIRHQNNIKRITEKENEILLFLAKNCNKIIKREELLEAVWGQNDYFLGRSLDVFITKIRKYLSPDSSLSIENVFGVGFIFNCPKN